MCLDKNRVLEIVSLLVKQHGVIDKSRFIAQIVWGKSLFEFTIAVMLSQNTSDANAIKAYNNLVKLLGEPITPVKVLSTPRELVVDAIRVAGMYNTRYSRLIELAKLFSSKDYVRDLVKQIEESDVENARETLLKLPGVGEKTADVILLMYFNKPTFPVDTHILRITKRILGLKKLKYEEARRFWMSNLDSNIYLETHLLLITHGRETCLARKPKCEECSINKYCIYYSEKNTRIVIGTKSMLKNSEN